MKLVNTDRRSRIQNTLLNDPMTIQLIDPAVDTFDTDPRMVEGQQMQEETWIHG